MLIAPGLPAREKSYHAFRSSARTEKFGRNAIFRVASRLPVNIFCPRMRFGSPRTSTDVFLPVTGVTAAVNVVNRVNGVYVNGVSPAGVASRGEKNEPGAKRRRDTVNGVNARNQFQVRIEFSSHVVTVSGHRLAVLLEALAENRVSRLIQPTENEAKFGVRGPNAAPYGGPAITVITVEEAGAEEEE